MKAGGRGSADKQKGTSMYADDKYKIVGTISIPEEKREEFNRNVEKVLDVFGIRQTEKRMVGDREITVLKKPEADEDGIVRFNYSMFEKRVREGDSYNTKTCQLICPDRGWDEFGVAMNSILIMQEAYSETPCFLMSDDALCPVGSYAAMIEDMTGVKLDFPHRGRILDVLAFLKQRDEYRDVDEYKLWNRIWDDTIPFTTDDIIELLHVKFMPSEERQKNPFCGIKSEIKDATLVDLEDYLVKEIKEYLADGSDEVLRDFYRELISSELPERRKMAEQDGTFGIIAEISLRAPCTYLVSAYAEAADIPFWELWVSLQTKGYRTKTKMYHDDLSNSAEHRKRRELYQIYRRDNEDEFLEFGAGHLSKKLLGQIAEWKEEVLEIQVPEEFDAERAAGQILWEMEHVWNCRYVSEEAVEIVQKNRDDVRWQKALLAFRKYMNAYQEYFPELPPELVTEQILVRERDYYCRTIMAAFWSLMMNETLRQDTFRF